MLRTTGTTPRGHGRAVALAALAAVLAATLIAWVPGATPASAAPIGTVTNYGRVIDRPVGITTGLDNNIWFTNTGTNTIGKMTQAGVVTIYAGDGISSPQGIVAGPDASQWFTNMGNNSIGRITTADGIVTNYTGTGIEFPSKIINGPGGLWFTNWDSIGRITTAGVVTIFTDPSIERPAGITAGQDGNVWFTNRNNNSIGRITPAGVVSNFTDPSIDQPMGITTGLGLDLYFTNNRSFQGSIGRITTAGVITNIPLPAVDGPAEITLGLDNNLWFTTSYAHQLGRMTPAGVVDMFSGNGAYEMQAIISGPDGNLWFTSNGTDWLGRSTTAGVITNLTGTTINRPYGIARGPDGNMWFANGNGRSVGRITPAGVVSSFTTAGIGRPFGITPGPDGNLWFTDNGANKIGRITTAGVITMYTDASISQPFGITAGPDGALWFTNFGTNTIGRILPDGVVTNAFTDASINGPRQITTGPDGALWFTNQVGYSIGRITALGAVSSYTGTGVNGPFGITSGPDGNLWFTNNYGNSIGRITTAGVVSNVTAPSIVNPYDIVAGPDGNLWFTSYNNTTVGKVTPAGVVTPTNLGQIKSPYGIASGGDGTLWFTNQGNYSIGRITAANVAGAPTAVVGVAGNTQVSVSWAAPADNGGSAISGYTVTSSPGAKTCTTTGALGCTVTGLTNGTAYTFSVTATNGAGVSPASAPSASVTPGPPATVPGAPTGVTAVRGNAQATVSWSAPASNGGSVITGYTVTSSPGAKTCSTAGTLSCVVTGLTNGTAYTFTVKATNAVGTGPASAASVAVTPATVPGAPTGVTAVAGNTQATVSWSAPGSNGGSAVTGYTVTSSPGAKTCSTAGTLTYAVTGLTNGTPYTFTVKATNAVGTGAASAASASVTPTDGSTVPGAPTAVTAVGGNGQATVSWSAPASNGGSVITGYTVTSSPGAKTCSTAGTLSCVVTGLTNGTAYTFTVKATNAVGTGAASAASVAVTPATVPGAPTGVTAFAGNLQATVSWSAPGSNGGSAVTGYTVTSSPGAKTCSTAGTLSCAVTGLTNGTAYTFTVKATNAVGTGAASTASSSVTPTAGATAPGAPTGVSAVAGKLKATVSWSAPVSNGGSAITGYAVTSSPGAATCTTTGALSCAVAGLTAGTSYTFTVKATNAVGTGSASAASAAVVPWDGSGYHALTPVRILDSRLSNLGFAGKVVNPTSRSLQVTGLGGASNVPATATAVVMNVTVADASDGSFLTVYPTGTAKPNASNLNFNPGQIIPNLVTVKLGTGGKVDVANAVGATHVIADVVGYYDDGTVPGDLFTGITPVRLLDSRTTTGGWSGPLPAGAPRDLVVRKPGNGLGVPPTATAVVANVTVTGSSGQSFVSVWPSGEAQPNVSNLNFLPGQTIPNLVTVKIGAGGAIRVANAVGTVEVIVDVVGYFDPTAGSRFHPINPNRILDTRDNKGLSGPQGPAQTRALAVAGAAGTNVPTGATGLVANVTVADATTESFVSVFPGNVARPDPFSNLNFAFRQVIPNLTAVGIAPNGTVNFYNHLGSTALIADAVGYYATT